MRIQPRITFEQYLATHRAVLAVKSSPVQKRSWRYYLALAVGCLALGIAAQSPLTRVPALFLFVGMILYAVIITALSRRSRNQCMRRIYTEEQPALNDQVLTIEESGITSDRGNGQISLHCRWDAFIYSIELPDAMIFLPTPNTFVRIPRADLSPSDDQRIREWSSGIPRKPVG
jgi:hypothetical protein